MGGCHENVFDIIIFYCLHSLYSFTATVLALEIIRCHSLAITEIGHCYYSAFICNYIFHRNFRIIYSYYGSSVISVFVGYCCHFITDDHKKLLLICKNFFEFFYSYHKVFIFGFYFFSFESCKSPQTHIHYRL